MDGNVGALYVRFRRGKVARTIPSNCEGAVINLDLNSDNEVIGIEAIGANQISIRGILDIANVKTAGIDFSKAPMRWAGALVPQTA